MNLMQSKLQQIFKDYLELKNYIQEDSKNIEQIKKELANQALEFESLEKQSELYFEKLGVKELVKLDYLEAQKKLYYYVQAYSDLVEIPEEIKNEVVEYKIKTVFAIIDGKKEIIDKDLYNFYKKQHQDYTIEVEKYLKLQQGAQQ